MFRQQKRAAGYSSRAQLRSQEETLPIEASLQVMNDGRGSTALNF
jgi:hypothetical protein